MFPHNRHSYKKINYCSAGHPFPIFHSKKEDKIIYLSEAQNPPLGIIPDLGFSSAEINYETGDDLLLYTDGLSEAKNKKGEPFTEKQIEKVLINNTGKNIPDILSDTLISYTGKNQFHDDFTVIYIRL